MFGLLHTTNEVTSQESMDVTIDPSNKSFVLSHIGCMPEDCKELTIQLVQKGGMNTLRVKGVDEDDTKHCMLFLTSSVNKTQRLMEISQFLALAKFPDRFIPVVVNLSQHGESPDFDDVYLHIGFSTVLQSVISSNVKHIHLFAMAFVLTGQVHNSQQAIHLYSL